MPGNDNASDDKQVFTPSKRSKPPETPKAIAKGSNKLQAKPPKSDDGEEEEVVEEVEDGSVKVKEESLQLLKTTLRRLRNSELLQCDSQLVRRHDGPNSEIAVCLSPFFPSRVAGVMADLATILVVFNARQFFSNQEILPLPMSWMKSTKRWSRVSFSIMEWKSSVQQKARLLWRIWESHGSRPQRRPVWGIRSNKHMHDCLRTSFRT